MAIAALRQVDLQPYKARLLFYGAYEHYPPGDDLFKAGFIDRHPYEDETFGHRPTVPSGCGSQRDRQHSLMSPPEKKSQEEKKEEIKCIAAVGRHLDSWI